MRRAFGVKYKTFFFVSKVLSFRLERQNSKNIWINLNLCRHFKFFPKEHFIKHTGLCNPINNIWVLLKNYFYSLFLRQKELSDKSLKVPKSSFMLRFIGLTRSSSSCEWKKLTDENNQWKFILPLIHFTQVFHFYTR